MSPVAPGLRLLRRFAGVDDAFFEFRPARPLAAAILRRPRKLNPDQVECIVCPQQSPLR